MYNRYYPYQYNRSRNQIQPPTPIVAKLPSKPPEPPPKPVPPPKPPAPPKPPPPRPPRPPKPKAPKKKFDFKSFKKNTCTSLNDVECFLNNFSNTWKYIRLIKLLK